NPIEASYSHYLMYHATGKDPLTFEEAFNLEAQRITEGYLTLAHFDRFRYYPQICRFQKHFPQVKVLLFDDLKQNLHSFLREVFTFLEVDENFMPSVLERINTTGVPRYQWLHNLLFKENYFKKMIRPLVRLMLPRVQRAVLKEKIKVRNISKPPMSEEMHIKLCEYFRDDVKHLEELLERSLNHWLTPIAKEGEMALKCNTTI
ncbi:MAG: hypothetical protein D6732_09990, partial [Methanobacteriota archaeon]